jgi:hypothetical protein
MKRLFLFLTFTYLVCLAGCNAVSLKKDDCVALLSPTPTIDSQFGTILEISDDLFIIRGNDGHLYGMSENHLRKVSKNFCEGK